ncbi:hypothetical protein [Terrisporobacter petrolearius]|uniref:hypothetical protein n=1 Tax=Terrisporobacter petrolearius TaxID=1460447 RepID=UPI0031CC4F19
MKRYEFETSVKFTEMVKELGLDGISDLDIGEESRHSNIEYKTLETWEYENGKLIIYAEETEEEIEIDKLLEKQSLSKEEVEFIEESSIIEYCEYMGRHNATNTTDNLWHVKLWGQEEEYSIVSDSNEWSD